MIQETNIKGITNSLFTDIQKSLIEKAMKEYTELKCKELLEIVAEKAKIKTEKKSQYGKYRKWQKVKDDEEFDLFDYEMRNSVDKDSILNSVDLKEFIK
jgi:hypothetical protein